MIKPTKKKNKGIKMTTEKVMKAIPGSYGIVTKVARVLKVDRTSLSEWINRDENVECLIRLREEEEVGLDEAEEVVRDFIADKDDGMTKWYLSRKGAKRGYNDKQIIEHEGKFEPISVVLDVHEKKKD